MDDSRFDALAKSVAHAPSRRTLLRALGGGGLLAGLGVALGHNPAPADVAAQGQGAACTVAFVGTVRVGPSANQLLAGGTTPGELRGQIGFTLDQKGAIAQGLMKFADGSSVPLVGQTTGRAINVRLDLGNAQQVFVAMGTAEQDLTACKGAVDGLLTGPQFGDIGDWHGTLGGTAASATATTAAAGATGQNAQFGQPSAPNPPGAQTGTTTTTAPPPSATVTSCPACQKLSSGRCAPVTDGTTCATGTCCGGACVDTTSDRANCGGCGKACSGVNTCISGVCRLEGGVPPIATTGTQSCGPGLTSCGGGCVDISSDPSNCGSCGNVCPAAQSGFVSACASGSCFFERAPASCASGLASCGGDCVDTSSDPNHCGGCDTVCASGQICFNGACATDNRCASGLTSCNGTCVNLTSDAGNCGACGNACPSGEICFGGACATDHR